METDSIIKIPMSDAGYVSGDPASAYFLYNREAKTLGHACTHVPCTPAQGEKMLARLDALRKVEPEAFVTVAALFPGSDEHYYIVRVERIDRRDYVTVYEGGPDADDHPWRLAVRDLRKAFRDAAA